MCKNELGLGIVVYMDDHMTFESQTEHEKILHYAHYLLHKHSLPYLLNVSGVFQLLCPPSLPEIIKFLPKEQYFSLESQYSSLNENRSQMIKLTKHVE